MQNLYRGVNAHLHSTFQNERGWADFHGSHITHLREALQALLPAESGYFVLTVRTRPDIGVYRGTVQTDPPESSAASTPTLEVPTLATIDDPDDVRGVIIVQADDSPQGFQIITRLEVLSPANKPPGSHYRQYLARRAETLLAGINLIEIDYLHETRSPLDVVPDYPNRAEGSFPYVIVVSDVRRSLDEARTAIYGRRVDEPLPQVMIPLSDEDTITLDMDAVYQHTFKSNSAYSHLFVDYSTPPTNFDAYDAEDQRRIHDVMRRAASTS